MMLSQVRSFEEALRETSPWIAFSHRFPELRLVRRAREKVDGTLVRERLVKLLRQYVEDWHAVRSAPVQRFLAPARTAGVEGS